MDTLDLSGFFNTPIANITPFTYRDGETYLEQIHRLKNYLDSITAQVNLQLTGSNDTNQAAITALVAQLNQTLHDFSNRQIAELLELENQAVAYVEDPTTGNLTTALNVALAHVYDNTRYYAYFANQLDGFEKTAAEWDAMEYTARHFDLVLGYSPTTTQAEDTVPATVNPN
jgi:hypothetical protein